MALPPPVLRNLALSNEAANFNESERQKVWEIGVPAKNSLYWSILLSYLLSSNDSLFSTFINDLKSEGSTKNKKKTKTLSSNVKFTEIKSRLYNFNPFKNRHVFFFDSKIVEVLTAFKLKLNQFASKMFGTEEWNDNIKIKAAAKMLQRNIDVNFPVEDKISFSTQSSESNPTLVLFEYRDQKHGSRTENINVFRFTMSVEHASSLKLSSLAHVLKRAKISLDDIQNIQKLMFNAEANEENFLSSILLSPHYDILPKLYKSPYIAVKLSQAGFETNPAVSDSDKPSAFLHASAKTETKYIKILYDYASNCRYLFESTVRDPNDTVLDNLKMLHDVLTKDKSKLPTGDCDKNIMERSLNALTRFNEYQQHIADTILKFKKGLSNIPTQPELMRTRKEFVCKILELYLTYFYYDVPKSNIMEIYHNYILFYEYYEIIDSFTCLSFFDAIYRLKKEFQLKDENMYAEIESSFLLLIQSNREFPMYKHDIKCCTEYCNTICQNDKNILLFIPLLHRETLKQRISEFLNTLSQHDQSPVPQNKIKDKHLRGTLSSYPDIIDEFLIFRIRIYLKAAAGVSFQTDGLKSVLIIERALQVLGESIKPQSTKNCVVTFLLECRIPLKLIIDLISIRNLLSHYYDSSATGRLDVESNYDIFDNLQNELGQIQKSFEIVALTQRCRLERYLIENCKKELINLKLDEETIENFTKHSSERLKGEQEQYSDYCVECISLSLNITKYLIQSIDYKRIKKPNSALLKINEILNSIEHVFVFLCRNINENVFLPYLQEIRSYIEKYRNDKNTDSLICDISSFLEKYRQKMYSEFEIQDISNSSSQFQTLESFFNCMKQNDISTNEIDVLVQAVNNAYCEAINAKYELVKQLDTGCVTLSEKEEKLLKRLIIPKKRLTKLRSYFKENNKKLALEGLKIEWTPVESVENRLKQMLKKRSKDEEVETLLLTSSADDETVKTLFIKIVFQSNLTSPIYSSTKLPEDICDKFEKFLMKKTNLLLNRIESMKSVLIDDDDEIAEAWNWGRSVEMKHHMKYLMRQRFIREMAVRSSLEMAFFDCLNILNKKFQFAEMFEKVDNLFAGINLRNVLSHGHSMLEMVGGLLDEDDLPSELINKMLELIDDAEAIISMKELISYSNTLEVECFESWIETNEDGKVFKKLIQKVTRCPRWKSYLFLLPLI